jgi:hypothetical protein
MGEETTPYQDPQYRLSGWCTPPLFELKLNKSEDETNERNFHTRGYSSNVANRSQDRR